MGKNKQAQRTKNNAKPSNSSRSAELLELPVQNTAGFSAFPSTGQVVHGWPSTTNNSEFNNIDFNFRLIFKRMSKKDGTTKFKALQEFAEVCHGYNLDDLKIILPLWPRFYCSLAVDIDHRVRESVQIAHSVIMKRVQKGILPYLKEIIGTWFTSQFDLYPPAASAASHCFNKTFPAEKKTNTVVYYQEEILNFICDNITDQTPQKLSLQKTLTPEELEAKSQKIIVSNLQAYSSYLKTVTRADIEKTIEQHHKILNNKFWKLAKHEAALVRAAFFNTLSSIISQASFILKEEKHKALVSITNGLEEVEPVLLSAVWESMLTAIVTIEDWHKTINIEKAVLPKLWRVLRSGGQYCASVIYPNLLPFVSQFSKLEIDKDKLITNFFSNMRQGFSAACVQSSRSESYAVITSFIECLRYIILQNSNNAELCDRLLKEQMIPVIESCIQKNLSIKLPLFSHVSHLVRYWSKNRDNEEMPSYAALLKSFWCELEIMFDKAITEASDKELSNICSSMADFVNHLKNAPIYKLNMRVGFIDSKNNTPRLPRRQNSDCADDIQFSAEIIDLTTNISVTYYKKITIDPLKYKVENMKVIMSDIPSKELFIMFAKVHGEGVTLLEFYEKHLKTWLINNTAEVQASMEFIFGMISFMEDSDKTVILNSFTEFVNSKIMRIAVQCSLAKQWRDDAPLRNWCIQFPVTRTLINIAEHIFASSDPVISDDDQNILTLAFEASNIGGLLVNSQAICGVTSVICTAIDKRTRSTESLNSLLSKLLASLWTHKCMHSGAYVLLRAVLLLRIRECTELEDSDNSAISTKTREEVWKSGLFELSKHICSETFIDLVKYCAKILWEKNLQIHESSVANSAVELLTNLTEAVIASSEHYNAGFAREISTICLSELDLETWLKDSWEIVLRGEILTGNLYVSSMENTIKINNEDVVIDLCSTNVKNHVVKLLRWALISIKVLNGLLLNGVKLPNVVDVLINVIHAITIGDIYSKHFKFVEDWDDLKSTASELRKELDDLKICFNNELQSELVAGVVRFCSSNSCTFPYILNKYYDVFESCINFTHFIGTGTGISFNTDTDSGVESYLQCLQILGNNLRFGNTTIPLGNDLNAIIFAKSQIKSENSIPRAEVLARIQYLHKNEPHKVLLNCDIRDSSWKQLSFTLQVISFLNTCVETVPDELSSSHWDLIEESLAAWQLTENQSKRNHDDFKVTAFVIGIKQLFITFQKLVKKCEKEPIQSFSETLLAKWENSLSVKVQLGIMETWMLFSDLYNERNLSLTSMLLCDRLGEAVKLVNENTLDEKKTNSPVITRDRLIKQSLKLLQSPVPSLYFTSYNILNRLVAALVECDQVTIDAESFDQNALNLCKFVQLLIDMQETVNKILADSKSNDSELYTYITGYFLIWTVILNLCAKARGDLRYQYTEIIKDELFPSLLNNIFRLMPIEVLHDNRSPGVVDLFNKHPSFDVSEIRSNWLDNIVCWLYTNCLRYLPVLVRMWWSATESKISTMVDHITTSYVSPILCQEELHGNRFSKDDNIQVKIFATAREVVATYQMDDTKLELSIVLPPNHPLGPVKVELGQGGRANIRNTNMQLSMLLTHQNGSIWDSLTFWKRNLDKKFAGVEECYICYSIFHISTYQIPKVSCRTCKKKFHTPCLYKWFNTSHKSTCPICRNAF